MQKLIIFDLDDVLYLNDNDKLADDAKECLEYLNESNNIMAVASHNANAKQIVKKLDIDEYFTIVLGECPPDQTKMPLIEKIMKYTNFNKNEEVIFFDDLQKNIDEVKKHNIKSVLVNWRTGISKFDLCKANL